MNISVTAPQVGYSLASIIAVIGITVSVGKYLDGKRKGIYKKIDVERENSDKKFVSKELCEERSGNIQKKLEEIGGDVKKLLTKNGIK